MSSVGWYGVAVSDSPFLYTVRHPLSLAALGFSPSGGAKGGAANTGSVSGSVSGSALLGAGFSLGWLE